MHSENVYVHEDEFAPGSKQASLEAASAPAPSSNQVSSIPHNEFVSTLKQEHLNLTLPNDLAMRRDQDEGRNAASPES